MSVSQTPEIKREVSVRNLHVGKPKWLKTPIPGGKTFFEIKKDLRGRKLATVCEEAKCPNIGECWNTRTATFMVLGDTCTRACRFCNVKTGNPNGYLDPEEPSQVAQSSKLMRLKYVVITMVDRDDLPDGGAEHVTKVMSEVKKQNPGIIIELLAGDFAGSSDAVKSIVKTGVEVYAHNIETIERLSPRVRDRRADYRQSLAVLKNVKEIAGHNILTKSALMLGLGEEKEEVISSLSDLRQAGVDLITIGQYMKPSKKHLSINRWVTPEEFAEYAEIAKNMGFLGVASKPLVRSSYMAASFYEKATGVVLS